jgi:histidine ammonia-lyase
MSPGLEIGAGPIDLATLRRAAAPGTALRLSPDAVRRIDEARLVVDAYAGSDTPVYGLNTGLGANVGLRLDAAAIDAFQTQLILGRCVGIGEALPEPVARLALLCRIIGLTRGGAGVSPQVVDQMIRLYNAGVTPVIPGRGSIGAGDLSLCAHLASVAIGRGEAWVQGRRMPGAEALTAAGLAPIPLKAKDGIGLINASAVSCGHAAVVLGDLGDWLVLSVATAALAGEGYAANPAIFDARLAEARPARGQVRAAALFRMALAGSVLYDPGASRSIQDALSFRVLSQIYAPVLDGVDGLVDSVEIEINAAADNPLILAEDQLILSTANFHTPAIALGFDGMALALASLAAASAQRVMRLMNPALSGLPKYLSPVGGVSAGLNALQKTVAALYGEIRLKAAPASLDALTVSETVEDHAPQTPLAIRKLAEQLDLLRPLIAIEALAAAQAVDLRGRPRLAGVTQRLYDAVRTLVPMLTEDRETGRDVDTVTALFRERSLIDGLGLTLAG